MGHYSNRLVEESHPMFHFDLRKNCLQRTGQRYVIFILWYRSACAGADAGLGINSGAITRALRANNALQSNLGQSNPSIVPQALRGMLAGFWTNKNIRAKQIHVLTDISKTA